MIFIAFSIEIDICQGPSVFGRASLHGVVGLENETANTGGSPIDLSFDSPVRVLAFNSCPKVMANIDFSREMSISTALSIEIFLVTNRFPVLN